MEPEFEKPIRMFTDSRELLTTEGEQEQEKKDILCDKSINVVTSK